MLKVVAAESKARLSENMRWGGRPAVVWRWGGRSDEVGNFSSTSSISEERSRVRFGWIELRIVVVEQKYMWKFLRRRDLASSKNGETWP